MAHLPLFLYPSGGACKGRRAQREQVDAAAQSRAEQGSKRKRTEPKGRVGRGEKRKGESAGDSRGDLSYLCRQATEPTPSLAYIY